MAPNLKIREIHLGTVNVDNNLPYSDQSLEHTLYRMVVNSHLRLALGVFCIVCM